MKYILITTDFSHHSKYTVQYVLNFMQETNIPCRIILLNTYLPPQTDPDQVISVNDTLRMKSKIGLLQEMVEAQKNIRNPLITIETRSHIGTLKNVILQLLQNNKFDLVAMGKNGGKHVETISVLLKQQHCPLLITYQDDTRAA